MGALNIAVLHVDFLLKFLVEVISYLHTLLDALIESILDVVVCASGNIFRDLSPTRAKLQIKLGNQDILFKRPPVLLDARVQLIEPALSALFGDAARDH